MTTIRPGRRVGARPGAADVLQAERELLAERGGGQVNLIIGAIEGKRHGLLGWAAGQVVF